MPDYAQGEMPRDKTRHLRVIYASMWCIQVHISFSISFLESRHNFHSDKIFMQVCDAFRSIFNFPTLSYFFGITSDKIYMKVYVKCLDQKKNKSTSSKNDILTIWEVLSRYSSTNIFQMLLLLLIWRVAISKYTIYLYFPSNRPRTGHVADNILREITGKVFSKLGNR